MERECLMCGTILEENEKYVCSECYYKISLIEKVKKVDSCQKRVEKACKKVLKKDLSYAEERDRVIERIMYNNENFNSLAEICFALQLEKENIEYYPNYRIGSHSVDFLLPKIKRIIEIDGELYHTNKHKDFFRERDIMRYVGEEYEIVRIPAGAVPDYIIKNVKESIDFVVEKRNFDGRFRDTRYDAQYWGQYLHLQKYGRRGR